MAPSPPKTVPAQPDLPAFVKAQIQKWKQVKPASNAWTAERSKRLSHLGDFIHLTIGPNLTSWKLEIDGAIEQAKYPTKPESRIFWYIALAGNLLWAATSLLSPSAAAAAASSQYVNRFVQGTKPGRAGITTPLKTDAANTAHAIESAGAHVAEGASKAAKAAEVAQTRIIQLMSFSGAAVGSGTIEQLFPNRDVATLQPEDGKEIVRTVVGHRRAELEKVYKGVVKEWAAELDALAMWEAVGSSDEPRQLYDKVIWEKMFPRIPYDDQRFNVIRTTARAKVEGVLTDYDLQWRRWVTNQMMPKYHQSEALYAMGTLAVVPKVFTAKLNFDLD
ncbi:hypothetical protein M2171_005554 [Bradyrhizobium japonicum USDA 38]|uniref:hypothetical protein n=1 Tax=Bradyrhizobium japonicum TaxID=375 RepID=UPI00048642DB|nr:hypothetical protein [Bradyrhizobium japonicum]MCS3896421.1 hypothetical protein [Bradyrhizobium japonicum USDA 38]MCS3948935.1 hypothetical protein [Bradyrhizobium japonicum]